MTGPGSEYTLFHRIAESASARIRLRVVQLGLKERIDFQNADTDARDDPRLGTAPTPALWDGHTLTVGEDQVAEKLIALRQDGPGPPIGR